MLKLNNRGWGFSTFVAFIAVFCVAIILIVIGAIRLGISSKQDVSNLPVTEVKPSPTNSPTEDNTNVNTDDYTDIIENYKAQLVNGAKNYVEANTVTITANDSLTITVVSLVHDNYVSKLEIKGNICTGYVTILNNSDTYEYKPFLSCGNGYLTEAYDTNLDESF